MKVAVTGATGFIGRNVLTVLLERGIEIIAVTRNAASLADMNKHLQVVEMDIANPALNCYEIMHCPEVMIHLAWDGLPNYNSHHHFEIELPNQYRFLKRMVEGGLRSLFVAGTCFEYGMQSGPLDTSLHTMPTNPYGYAKDALRHQLQFLKSIEKFNFAWGRLFYMYGPGQPNTSLYPKLREAALRGDKIFNMSGGEQLRDYLHVTEVAKKIVQIALTQSDIGVANICSGQPISIRRLVAQWLEENGWELNLNYGYYPYPDYEPMAFWGVPLPKRECDKK